MATTQRLPSQSSLARGHKLNPIIEEDSDDGLHQFAKVSHQARRQDTSHLKIQAWLSPMSDHFPTPRGVHYLAAPILPSDTESSTGDTSPTTSSNAWNRMSVGTQNTEFEDLYDVSDDEKRTPPKVSAQRSDSTSSNKSQYIQILLPVPEVELKKSDEAPPPTPGAQLPMSPAQLNFMDKQQALEVPTISAPPSLDGSLSSEQLATMSAPATPVEDDAEDPGKAAWEGVQLQPDALRTLQALSGEDESIQEASYDAIPIQHVSTEPAVEMQHYPPPRLVTRLLTPVHSTSTRSRTSLSELSKLEIPSPENFFGSLSPRSRNTWQTSTVASSEMPSEEMVPPTSTTAEQFYRCPWNAHNSAPPVPKLSEFAEDFYRSTGLSSSPVEQVVELPDDIVDDMPTARPIVVSLPSEDVIKSPSSPGAADIPTEIVIDFDPEYARKQQEEALSNLDRTELWLLAQRSYLKVIGDREEDDKTLETIREGGETEDEEEEKPIEATPPAVMEPSLEKFPSPPRKTVRFSDLNSTTAQPKRLPSKLVRQESAYYRAFLDYFVRAHGGDAFVHQLSRFEALQAQRVSLRQSHLNQLLGKYQLSVVPQSAKKRLSTNVVRGDDTITDDLEKLRREKEWEAAAQMSMPTWHVAATKFLNGGSLITSPVTKRLARLSQMAPGKDGVTRDRARILDLGGQSTCDWAWHCALQYPNTKVYTVTTKAVRQLSNANIRGPPNHRQVAVDRLTRLPFGDNQFDLVYARDLHSILKLFGENGQDEWEICLRECMRVLKPGGYIEFSVLDSEIMNAGPLGHAKSVEFGFSLKTLGYDPNPTKMWLGRLGRAGFKNIRRTWQCLPLGPKKNLNTYGLHITETSEMGSSESIAGVCSMVGGWNWERWLLRCEMEKVAGEMRLADTVTVGAAMEEAGKCLNGVAALIEEGRNCNAGFRMLSGYARKPTIHVDEA
ncbi:unnamed protein product [Clonostachys rosea]|uniref:Methyltransferase type 11 domain-containing protein n=1 Tax=Bionectria ochroleuca TaxID=29856 RepID=A0ABY6UV15_BIOOC|nr:unnamed protein product [Clonostachys rosea]